EWYADYDEDGFGDAFTPITACDAPSGYLTDDTDCDDSEAGINPEAEEACDEFDNDCDGATDEGAAIGAKTWYVDSDGDTYGTATIPRVPWECPAGYADDATDCNDGNSAIHPSATETCDSIDNDCDGSSDEAGSVGESTWYADTDSDTYGNPSSTLTRC